MYMLSLVTEAVVSSKGCCCALIRHYDGEGSHDCGLDTPLHWPRFVYDTAE